MSREDARYSATPKRHDHDKCEHLSALGQLYCRAGLEALVLNAMTCLTLREGKHSVGEAWVDLLVFA